MRYTARGKKICYHNRYGEPCLKSRKNKKGVSTWIIVRRNSIVPKAAYTPQPEQWRTRELCSRKRHCSARTRQICDAGRRRIFCRCTRAVSAETVVLRGSAHATLCRHRRKVSEWVTYFHKVCA